MNYSYVLCVVLCTSLFHLCGMEKSKKKVVSKAKHNTSYLQRLPADIWGELFLHMAAPGSTIDNRADIIMQTHANAHKVMHLACEFMDFNLPDNKDLNKKFIHASEAYYLANRGKFTSFYLPNEISLACALRTPGSRRMLKENLESRMQNFRAMPQNEKNKMLFDVMRRCASKTIIRALLHNGAQVNARCESSDYTPLRYAVDDEKESVVRLLLREGARPDISDRHKTNSLMRACILANEALVALLAPKTMTINAMNLFGRTALIYAAKSGNLNNVRCLINHGARVMRSDESGQNNVYVAAVDSGDPDMLSLILSVEEPDHNNGFFYNAFMSSALKRAAELGNSEMINVFLQSAQNIKSPSGFSPNLRPDEMHSDGFSPLTAALARDHTLIAIDLINFASDKYDKSGGVYGASRNLALAWATSKYVESSHDSELRKHYDYILYLMMKDDNPNPLDAKHSPSACFFAAHGGNELLLRQFLLLAMAHGEHCRERALFEAVQRASISAVRTILKTNPDINWVSHDGTIVFWHALRNLSHEQLDIFDDLIRCGADIHKTDAHGATPIHLLVENNDAAAVNYMLTELCKRGVAIDSPDDRGNTPLILVSAKKIRSSDTKSTRETAALLVEYGADVNRGGKHGNTPLIYAAGTNNIELVALLLRHNADPNKRNHSGCGPLTKAARRNNLGIARLLVEAGANISAFRDSMLRQAAKMDNVELVEELLLSGADINSASSSLGNTPAHKAVLRGSINALRVLLRHGANLKSKNRKGQTPLELALSLEDSSLSLLLTEYH